MCRHISWISKICISNILTEIHLKVKYWKLHSIWDKKLYLLLCFIFIFSFRCQYIKRVFPPLHFRGLWVKSMQVTLLEGIWLCPTIFKMTKWTWKKHRIVQGCRVSDQGGTKFPIFRVTPMLFFLYSAVKLFMMRI